LNPIENLWFESKGDSPKTSTKDIKDLGIFCMEEGSKIHPNVFSKHFGKNLSLFSQGESAGVLKTGLPIMLIPFLFFWITV
jgi:hypothetical protein